MKIILSRKLVLFLILLTSVIAAANAGEAQGTIAEMVIDKGYGDFAFIRFDTAPNSPIACSVNGYWHFTLPLTGDVNKRMFAMLVTARVTGGAVKAVGSGACNEFGKVESLQRIGL